MPLLSLPNELLLLTASFLPTPSISHLLLSNRHFHALLTPQLHTHALREKDGLPALHWAVIHQHYLLATLLLRLGVSVNARERAESCAALHWGAKHGEVGIIRLLLDHGADVAACNSLNETPLHRAAAYGREGAARMLLETAVAARRVGEAKGGYVDRRDMNGWTALDWAARYGYVCVCRCLIEAGADVSVRDDSGGTARMSALEGGHIEVAKLLEEREREVGIVE